MLSLYYPSWFWGPLERHLTKLGGPSWNHVCNSSLDVLSSTRWPYPQFFILVHDPFSKILWKKLNNVEPETFKRPNETSPFRPILTKQTVAPCSIQVFSCGGAWVCPSTHACICAWGWRPGLSVLLSSSHTLPLQFLRRPLTEPGAGQFS